MALVFAAGCGTGTTKYVSTATTGAALSASSFNFGDNLVGLSETDAVVTVTNYGTAPITLSPSLSGDSSYALIGLGSCGKTLAAGASCDQNVSYTPTTASAQQTAVLNMGFGSVIAGTPDTVTLTGTSATLAPGTVTSTNNPQVALYTMTLPFPGTITVNLGTSTSYGRSTWSQSTTVDNGQVSIFVAGMLQNTTYHMQAAVAFTNGLKTVDVDHTFATGASPLNPTLQISTAAGFTPSAGVEELTFVQGILGLSVADLQGNMLWSYVLPNDNVDSVEGAKLLPNGDFLLTVGQNPSASLYGPVTGPGLVNAVREINLAGDIVKEITAADLSHELQAAGYDFNIEEIHHDITPLPNGHWLVLANTELPYTNLTGLPGTTYVLGDLVIDLDTNLQPVWVWNEFDHFDVNRHPFSFPDWTHSNAVVYTPTDGNLIVSMRDQNWVVKVDYANGTGAGDVLWKLGEGGDFTLVGGVDPTDWAYAQHYPSLFSSNSAGAYSLGLMDNGDDREFASGVTCGATGAPVCHYTTVPVFALDETAKTATLTFHAILPAALYNSFGGNTELLANGDIEYDLAGVAGGSYIEETTMGANPQGVWQLHIPSVTAYRGYRIPSLYPGVQW